MTKRNRTSKKALPPIKADWTVAFLAALTQACTITQAARAAGKGTCTVYDRRRVDAKFSAAWDEAVEQGTQHLEAEANRRAISYRKKVVLHQGEVVFVWIDNTGEIVHPSTVPDPENPPPGFKRVPLYEEERSDTLIIFLLKARRPEVYRDRVSIGGDNSAPPIQTHMNHGGSIAVNVLERIQQLTNMTPV